MKHLLLLTALMGVTLFADALGWSSSYAEALQKAQQSNKSIYMLITSQNCRWCRKFENTTLQEEAVRARLQNNYVLVHIDRDANPLPSKFQVAPVPRHYIVKPDGAVIHTFIGFWEKDDFFSYLDDAQKRLKNMTQKEEK